MPLQKLYSIKVDAQEKIPLIFPPFLPTLLGPGRRGTTVEIRTEVVRLVTGDYVLGGYEGVVGIERKRDMDELGKNLFTSDRRRFEAELRRLQGEFKRPILLFEGGIPGLGRATPHNPEPYLVTDALLELLASYNVGLLALPGVSVFQRQKVGELAARIMIRGALALA